MSKNSQIKPDCPYISQSTTQIGQVAVTTAFSRITDTTHALYETCALCAKPRVSEHKPREQAQVDGSAA